MPTYLVRWPNGTLSIVTADDPKDLFEELQKEDVCTPEERNSPHGLVLEMSKGFRLHFHLTDESDLAFLGFSPDAMPTVERLYPSASHGAQHEYSRELLQRAMDYAKNHLLPPPALEDYRSRDQAETKCPLCGDGSSDPRSRGGFTYPNGLERHLTSYTNRCAVLTVMEEWWHDVQRDGSE